MKSPGSYLSTFSVSFTQQEISLGGDFSETIATFKASTGWTTFLPLDVYNRLANDLIDTCGLLKDDVTHLKCRFEDSLRLCIDLHVSKVLASPSLSDAFKAEGLQSIPDEFVIALIWDESPNYANIAKVLAKLTGSFEVSTRICEAEGHLHRLILSKGVVCALVIPEEAGRVKVVAGGAVLGMTWEEAGRMAVKWELRPDLVFCTTTGIGLIQNGANWKDVVSAMSELSLKEELPYVELEVEERKTSKVETLSDDSMMKTPVSAGKSPVSLMSTPEVCPICKHDLIGPSCIYCQSNAASDINLKRAFDVIQPVVSPPERPKYEGISNSWTCECGKLNYSLTISTCSRCYKRRTPPVPLPSEPEKWQCPVCSSMNPSSTAMCESCSKQDNTATQWICTKCSTFNAASLQVCKKCGNRRPVKSANGQNGAQSEPAITTSTVPETSPPVSPAKAEHWVCVKCGERNIKSRENCYKCRQSKITATSATPPSSKVTISCPKCGKRLIGTSECSACAPRYAAAKTSSWKPAEEGKKIEEPRWACLHCGEKDNYSEDLTCYSCHKRRGSVPSSSTWNCDNCGAVNVEQAINCELCGLKRSPKPTLTADTSPSKWTCKTCRTANPLEKTYCLNCYKPKDTPVTASTKTTAPNPPYRSAFTSYETREIQSPPKRKYCECGREIFGLEEKCGACEAKVISPARREGKLWKCLHCGDDNPADREKCKSCYRSKPISSPPIDINPKCQKCGRYAGTGETLCSNCRLKQSPTTQSTKWTCKNCRESNLQTSIRCTSCKRIRI